ncbi:MAG: DUF72 domain-containing protein, partial [Chthoniobacter sp.]|nr:DUF72 domain-containing protein [Chthoniobacter sp.]
AVEVDSTFYHIPTPHTAAHWYEITPPGFRFACKMPREITHERKLRDASDALAEFLTALQPLGEKLTCVLVQTPPFFTPQHDASALREFVRALPGGVRFAFEFRHPGWHVPRFAHLLEERGVSWVWSDSTTLADQAEGAFAFLPDTAGLAYVRLLGDFEKKYNAAGHAIHRYGELLWPRDPALESWAVRIRQAAEAGHEVFVAANNHYEGFAPRTCQRLAARLGRKLEWPGTSADEGPQMKLL